MLRRVNIPPPAAPAIARNWNPTREAKAAVLRALPGFVHGRARVFLSPTRPPAPTPEKPDVPPPAGVPAMLVLYAPLGLDANTGDRLTASHTMPRTDGTLRKVGAWRFNADGVPLDSVAPFGDATAAGAWLAAMPDAARSDVAQIAGLGSGAWGCDGSLDSWALALGLCVEAEATRAA
jgi:hypothetical protein